MRVSATGSSVRYCISAARRVAKLTAAQSKEVLRSGGEDGLYRVHLEGGHVVECSVVQRGVASAWIEGAGA